MGLPIAFSDAISRRQLQVPALDPFPDGTAHRVRRRQWRRQDQPLSRAAAAAGLGRWNPGARARRRGRHAVRFLGRQASRRQPARITLSAGFGEADAGGRPAYSYEVRDRRAAARRTRRLSARAGPQGRSAAVPSSRPRDKLLERRSRSVMARDADGKRTELSRELLASETALGSFNEPQRFPEIHAIQQMMLDWRFYHGLRTDADSALRRPCLAVATPTMASDGSNLAAVLATLIHIRRDTVDARPRDRGCLSRRAARRAAARAARRRSAWSFPTIRAGCSRRASCPTARCAISRWPARCCRSGCRPSSR